MFVKETYNLPLTKFTQKLSFKSFHRDTRYVLSHLTECHALEFLNSLYTTSAVLMSSKYSEMWFRIILSDFPMSVGIHIADITLIRSRYS